MQRHFPRSLLYVVAAFALNPFAPTLRAAPVAFDLPAATAADSLLAFSKQAGVEVLFPFDDLRAVQSAALAGSFEPDEALTRLLRDTGFYARRTATGKFIIGHLTRPTGSIKGRVLLASAQPAVGVKLALSDGRHVAESDSNGEFALPFLPPGKYQLRLSAPGLRPLEIVDLRVDADRVLNLETQTLLPVDELVRLAPQIVEGKFYRHWKARDTEDYRPQQAGGNLDLPRTEDDALPYTIYDRDQISRSGVVNLSEFIQRSVLDGAAATRPSEQDGSKDVFIASSSNITLRGYGASETIVLVNGRRLPEMLLGGPNENNAQSPDVNFIPLSLVDRIEVLPVSASALYTGNPVGGIVNIVLRPDAQATELNATYTNALGRFDAPQSTLSLQHGQSLLGGKLRVRLNATFTQSVAPAESELGYIAANHAITPVNANHRLYRATPNIRSADDSPLFGPGSATFTSVAPGADGRGGLAAFQNREGVRSLALFDTPGGLASSPESVDYVYGRKQRGQTWFGSATWEVFPSLQLGLDGILSRSVATRGFGVYAGNLTLAKDSPFNPFDQEVEVTLNETTPLLGERFSEARQDYFSVVGGALIRLPSDWRVGLDAQYGHSVTRYRGIAQVDTDRWQQLVDRGLYNPLRDTQVYGPPAEFYDQALVYYRTKGSFAKLGDYTTFDAAIRVTNQSLPLPTGNGALNFGGDYRMNRLAPYDDIRLYGDGSLYEKPTHWSGRSIQRMSGFAELQAPLLPATWLPRGVRAVESDLAVRYVLADSANERNTAPTAGLKIDFAGGWSLRGSIATSNRLPPPYLRGKSTQATDGGTGGGEVSTVTITDPRRNNERYGGVLASDAINANLHPESAVTHTIGLLFQRGKIHRLRASLDFADTQKSGEITRLEPQDVVNLETIYPDRVTRDARGYVTSLRTGNVNLAWRHSQNWNTAVDYAWTEAFGGRLDVYGRWSYFNRYEVQLLPGTAMVDELNHPDLSKPDLLKHRMNFGATWSKPTWGLGWDGHYFHSRTLPEREWADQHRRQINPYWQFDAFVQADLARWLPWKLTRFDLRGQLRVNNLFNAQSPRYANDPSNAGVQSYSDWRGQTYALTVNATY